MAFGLADHRVRRLRASRTRHLWGAATALAWGIGLGLYQIYVGDAVPIISVLPVFALGFVTGHVRAVRRFS